MVRFGTGGWRAIIADEFTKANIRLLTAGLCSQMLEEGLEGREICVGYDRRFLSKESAHWAAEVFCGYGFRVYMINRSSPTPLIMFTIKQRQMPYGIAVTASHNPAIYNGIKVFTAGGRDADKTVTNRIEKQMENLCPEDILSIDYDRALEQGLVQEANPTNAYIDSILSSIDVEAIKNAQLRVALDPMYGVSETCLSIILMTCRCDVSIIHSRHDTLFGGKLPAPNEDTMGPLSAVVLDRYRCDLGIATDGDADRLGVIDDLGRFVHPNKLLVLLYYYLVKYRGWQGPCVRNNSTTHLLDKVAEGLGQKCYEVPVGFKYVSAKMTETGAIIGGESSGGLAVKGHISGKDGIYAAALLVEMLAKTGKKLSELYQEILDTYGELSYKEADFTMTPQRKAELQSLLFEKLACPDFDREIDHISREDGVKTYFKDGSWVICRFSGTEPLLRMAAEASDASVAQGYIDRWKAFCSCKQMRRRPWACGAFVSHRTFPALAEKPHGTPPILPRCCLGCQCALLTSTFPMSSMVMVIVSQPFSLILTSAIKSFPSKTSTIAAVLPSFSKTVSYCFTFILHLRNIHCCPAWRVRVCSL